MNWNKATEAYFSDYIYTGTIFVNTYTGAGPGWEQWNTVDLKPAGVTSDAKAAFIGGILIITPGNGGTDPATGYTEPGIEINLTVRFRKPGDDAVSPWGAYCCQAVDRNGGGTLQMGVGVRTYASLFVPLSDGCFEWGWDRNTLVPQPYSASYGINMNVTAWFR